MIKDLLFRLMVKVGGTSKRVLKPVVNAYQKYRKLKTKLSYHPWAVENEETCFVANEETSKVKISIVVPTFNTDRTHLMEMVYSVINQHYENWELILVNASTKKAYKEAVKACEKIDNRIKVVTPDSNLGIAENTNFGLQYTNGEFVAFCDHDDLLHPCALHCIAHEIESQGAEFIYTDEDKIDHESSRYFDPLCKPRWSPQLLENLNYINHLTVIKRNMIEHVGGLRPEFDGAQDYDLNWRVIDICKPKISHIPHVLYHWRAAKSSTAKDISTKEYIFEAGVKTVNEHFKRLTIDAQSTIMKGKPGFYRTVYKPMEAFTVAIGPVDQSYERICAWWLDQLIKKELKKPRIHLIVGEWYREYAPKDLAISFVPAETTDYWSNAQKAIDSEVVLCFQQAVLPKEKGALIELANVANGIDDSLIAPVIVGKDCTILDAGLVESEYGLQPLFKGYKYGENTILGDTDWVRNVSALTLNVFATKRNTLRKLIAEQKEPQPNLTLQLKAPNNIQSVIWAHAVGYYKGFFRDIQARDQYFNPQVDDASYEITMKTSSWEGYDGRSEK